MLTVVPDGCPGREGWNGASPSLIDEIAREGARRMGAGALRAGVDAYIARFAGRRGGDGREELIALGWFRKTASLLAALPGSVHPGAKKALAGILIERPEPAAA
jgi:hypothetical protein